MKSEAGHWGFPKGKRERGESTLETALRELREETSLCTGHIVLKPDVLIEEMSDKGQLSVRYLVATVCEPCVPVQCDPDHVAVAWVPVEQARAWLRPSRRAVLDKALAEMEP